MRNMYDNLIKTTIFGAFLMGATLVSFQGQAQEQQAQTPSNFQEQPVERAPAQESGKQEKKKTLSFEDELVEGATQKPELFYLFQKKNFNYKRLIKLRENFLPEMRKTSEDLQRVRSSN